MSNNTKRDPEPNSTHDSSLDDLLAGLTSIRFFEDGDKKSLVLPLKSLASLGGIRGPEKTYDSFDCPVCEDLAINRPDKGIWGTRSISELHEGAQKGCKYCLLLCKGIRACVPEVELTDDNALEARLAKVFPQRLSGRRPANKYGISVIRGDDEEHWENTVIPAGSTPIGDTSSLTAFDRAKGWLQNCLENHERCGTGEALQSPTRLIDAELDESQDVRLVELDGAKCQYACLSHCWGKTDSIKTTKATLQQRKDRIDWVSLCPTFQDAISVVRQLDIRYIWIDSLCIIQDDLDDWDKESSQMGTVYSSAYLTIAATRSSNHDGGCFSKTSPQFQTHEISLNQSGEEKMTLFFRQTLPHMSGLNSSPDQAEEFPLLSRGWVYQERLLSPRVLHFQNNELAWECGQCSRCECEEEAATQILAVPETPKMEHVDCLNDSSTRARIDRWHQLVQEFSSLQMTFQKDTLPGLAGLAKQMSSFRPDEQYIAGMWDYTIMIDMLWAAKDDQVQPPDTWRGPSWSWISTTSPVEYPSGLIYALIKTYPGLHDSNVRVSSVHNRFGPVQPPTWLKMEGSVFKSSALHFLEPHEVEEDTLVVQHYGIIANGSLAGIFSADYDLKSGGRYVEPLTDGSSVELLLTAKTDNWKLYLVLKTHFSAPEYVITHDFENSDFIDVRERIGLLRIPCDGETEDVISELESSDEVFLLI